MSDQSATDQGSTSPEPSLNDWNTAIIEEFRANAGVLGGSFENAPVLLLHTTGAKTGLERVNPMMYLRDGGRTFVFASKAGAPTHPDWYHNLVANPRVTVEIGSDSVAATAQVLDEAERARVYAVHAARFPGFAEYELKTDRTIPVVELVFD